MLCSEYQIESVTNLKWSLFVKKANAILFDEWSIVGHELFNYNFYIKKKKKPSNDSLYF